MKSVTNRYTERTTRRLTRVLLWIIQQHRSHAVFNERQRRKQPGANATAVDRERVSVYNLPGSASICISMSCS